jgi:hypothetical protein
LLVFSNAALARAAFLLCRIAQLLGLKHFEQRRHFDQPPIVDFGRNEPSIGNGFIDFSSTKSGRLAGFRDRAGDAIAKLHERSPLTAKIGDR